MNAKQHQAPILIGCVSGAVLLALSTGVHADTRSIYDLTFSSSGQHGLQSLDAYTTPDRLRPGFRSDVHRPAESFSVQFQERTLSSLAGNETSAQILEASGDYTRRVGGSGLGYVIGLDLGLYAPAWSEPLRGLDSLDVTSNRTSLFISDFSAGPSYDLGNLSSRVRVGVRYPLTGETDALANPWQGHRGDLARTGTGYLSVDGRYRFSNQAEVSLSVFYDDANLLSTGRDWLNPGADRANTASGLSQSVVGFEMGLNF